MHEKEFAYHLSDFNLVRQKIYEYAGIFLTEAKKDLVYSRLSRRIRALSLRNFSEYLQVVERNSEERQAFINALTTNLTYFFREPHHFEYLAVYLKALPKGKQVTIWCAAASTGEEPYSIALTAMEAGITTNQLTIVATDINNDVLRAAERGVYSIDQLKPLSMALRQKYFMKGKGTNQGKVKVCDNVRRMITFEQLNLLHREWKLPGAIDIIFCRNVMIYFDKDTQKRIFYRMMSLLPPKGIYFAGHSENFTAFDDVATLTGKSVYMAIKGHD